MAEPNTFNVKIIQLGQRTDSVECTCGEMALIPHDEADSWVHNHLFGFHGCNPDTTEFRSV